MNAAEKVREYERQANGSEKFYRHWLGRLVYTAGIHYMAEQAGAHWFVDAVASHQPRVRRKLHRAAERDFQVWRLRKMDSGAWAMECWSDTPGRCHSIRLAYQRIPYSDFPAELAPFECYVEDGTMMLKGER